MPTIVFPISAVLKTRLFILKSLTVSFQRFLRLISNYFPRDTSSSWVKVGFGWINFDAGLSIFFFLLRFFRFFFFSFACLWVCTNYFPAIAVLCKNHFPSLDIMLPASCKRRKVIDEYNFSSRSSQILLLNILPGKHMIVITRLADVSY